MLTPRIRSARQICQIGRSMRELRIISILKVDFPILRVKANFVICKISEKLNPFSFLYLKDNNMGHVIQELIQITLLLLHWGSTFMKSIKNDQFRGPLPPTSSARTKNIESRNMWQISKSPTLFRVDVIDVWSLAP